VRLRSLRGDELAAITVESGADLQSAMQKMNNNGWTFVLVVDDDRLIGVLADGDIRRHLAQGGGVDDGVTAAINAQPVTLPHDTPMSEVRSFMMRRGFEYLPTVDGVTIDALCILERAPRASELTAVILAGGLGSRLAPLTDDCPKPLLPLGDRPILTHIIEQLRSQGVTRFVLAVNHLSNMIVDYYDDGSRLDCFIDYVHETKRLGTGGPLGLVDAATLSDPFLCLNGDVLNDLDVGALRDAHLAQEWDATMVVRDFHYTVPYGVVETGDNGEMLSIHEKPTQSFQISAGIYMLSKSVLTAVPPNEEYDMPTLFDDVRRSGMRTGVHTHQGRWIDIGSMADYDRAKRIIEGPTS
jgi:dTDP-glucose pyrophosphorylase